MSLKIYSYPHNPKVAKALIAAEYAGVQIQVPAFKFPDDCHTAEFKAKHNPCGKVPVLETPHGSLFESNAILRYVARLRADNNLYGGNFWEQAQIDQWLDFNANELESARAVWMYPLWGVLAYDEKAYIAAKNDVANALSILDAHLLKNSFMVGNGVTIADISIACALFGMYKEVFDAEFRARFPSVQRWFETVASQDEFKKHMGAFSYAAAEKRAAGADGAAAEAKGKGKGGDKKPAGDKADKKGGDKKKDDKPKGDKKDGKEKPEKADKKKDDKPADKPAGKPAGDKPKEDLTDLMDEKPEKKAKNPLDDLPESKMIMDATKKLFFNQKPFNPKFWSEFWPNFDPKGYSLFTIKYKYNSENTVYFMTCNLVGGFIQRAEDCRKYAFGVVNMYGKNEETAPYGINGAWLFRGPDIIKEMREVPDSEYFEWTKVDPADAAGRALIEKMFTGENPSPDAGDKLLERRYFK